MDITQECFPTDQPRSNLPTCYPKNYGWLFHHNVRERRAQRLNKITKKMQSKNRKPRDDR